MALQLKSANQNLTLISGVPDGLGNPGYRIPESSLAK
jgi:hypothetical protein